MFCKECKTKTSNPKFCSRSCAASFNNRAKPKRSPESTCARCGTPNTKARTYCKRCWNKVSKERMAEYWKVTTLGEMKALGNANKANRYPHIRTMARKLYKKSKQKMSCKICGYSLHVDICHIKEIKSFPLSAKISEINNLQNLVALCKTHHWELDNHYLSPEDFDALSG